MNDLEQARADVAQEKANFEHQAREACLALGRYCQALEIAQRLTSAVTIGELGVPLELQNKLRELLIKERPHMQLERDGFEPFMGFGWNTFFELRPMVKTIKGEIT